MYVETSYCTCPQDWPRVIPYVEDGWPVTSVQHHWGQCWRSSIRVDGTRTSRALFDALVAAALGERMGKQDELRRARHARERGEDEQV